MPTYLCHGFRWQRRSIRVYTVVQDLDDVSPEWLIKPTSSRCLLQSFYNLFECLPYCTPPPPGAGRGYDSGSWANEESEEDSEKGSDEGPEEGIAVVNGQEKNERSQWPERLESLGVIRASREKAKGKGKSVEGKGEDASSAITAIHVGSESTSRTASRSPSLKLPLQGSRISSKTRQTATSAATTPTTVTSVPTSRTTSILGGSSSSRKNKKMGRSRSVFHSPNRKKDELSAQRWSAVKVLEEYDPNNLDEVSRPYAYVADHAIRVDGAVDILAEVKRYEEKMQQQKQRQKGEDEVVRRDVEKGRDEKPGGRGSIKNRENRDSAGSRGTAGTVGTAGRDEEYHDALEHLEENTAVKEKDQTWIEQLRDELQRGEEIKWYVVVNGDEERNYSNDFDEDDEDETEDDCDEELLSDSNYNYGTSYESEDLTTSGLANRSPSLAAYSPTEAGNPYLSQHSVGSRSRTSSRGGRSKSKSRSQSRSHSRTRDRHRNHSRHRDRHGGKRRRPKPTKEQRQHHAQYTLQQELFERNDLRASSSATTSGTSTPTPTPTPVPVPTTTTAAAAAIKGSPGSATATARPPTAMRSTKAIIKEGAARRVMSEGGIHRQSSRGIPVVPRSPEIPIIMVTPTRMTFSGSPTGASGAGAGAGTVDAGMNVASGRRVVSEQQHKQQQNQPQHQLQEQQQQHQQQQQQHQYERQQEQTRQPQHHELQQQQHQYERQQEQPRQPQHNELQQQQLQQHLQQQHQPQQQQREYPTASTPTAANGSSMGIITTAPAAAVSSFSLDTTPSNTVPGPSNPSSHPNPSPKSHHPPLSFGGNGGHGNGHRHGTTSKRSSLTSLRTPSSWSCLNLSLGHGHKDGHGQHSTSPGDKDNGDIIQPPRPSPSPPIALHPNDSYEPVSTLPPRPAPPPPAFAAQRPGRPLTPPPPIGTGYEFNNHRVPTAPSSPVAIKISATPAETMMMPEAQGQEQAAAAPPVVGQYSSKTMPTRKGNHGYGNRSRSSGSLRRLFQRTSGKEGWI